MVWLHPWLHAECVLRDVLVANAECIVDSRVCALSVECQVRRPYHALHTLHEDCMI